MFEFLMFSLLKVQQLGKKVIPVEELSLVKGDLDKGTVSLH